MPAAAIAALAAPELLALLGKAKGTGAITGATKGISQLLSSRRSANRMDSSLPAASDPTQLAFMAELNQKRKSLNTGSSFAADMGYIGQSQAGTDQAIVQATGGDVGGTIQALLGSQSAANRARNQVLARGDEQEYAYNTFYSDTLNRIAQRKLEVDALSYSQASAEKAQYRQDAFGNISNAIARTSGGIDWKDLLARHGGARRNRSIVEESEYINPEMAARELDPIQNTLSTDPGLGDVQEPDLTQIFSTRR